MAFDAVASIAAQWEVLGEEGVIRSIQAMAKRSKSALDPRAITDTWNAVLPKIGEKFRDTLKNAITSGLDIKQVAKFTESFGALKGKMQTAIEEVAKIETKLAAENLDKLDKKKLQSSLKLAHDEVNRQQNLFAREMRHVNMVAERRSQVMKEAGEILNRSMSEGVEAFGEGLESAFGKIQSGDFAGLLKGMGKGMGARGEALKGGKLAQMKGIGPAVQGIGGMMTKLAPVIAGLGAVVGAIAAVIAIVVAADSQLKGFNKSLLEGGVQMGDLKNASEGAADAVTGISQGFAQAIEHNWAWGTTAQDNLDILAAYGGAGLTIKELAKNTEDAAVRMEHLKEATSAALTYSRLLGVSSSEVATNFADYMEELGMTLGGIQQRFSGIYSAAMESGFGIKRFYGMVLQATSGMSMYNVRLEEAASLLIHLGRILGQKMGGDFLQSLMQGFKDEDTQTRTQKVMKRGIKETLSDGRAGAAESAKELLRKIADFKKADADKGGQLEAMLVEKVGLTLEQAADPAKLAEAMSKLTQKQLGELSVEMKTLGETGVGISRAMEDVHGKSMAFRGGLGGAQATRKHMDPGMVLWNRLNAAKGVGVKRLDTIEEDNIPMNAAFEAVASESGKSVDELKAVGRTFTGYHSQLAKAQEEIKKAGSKEQAEEIRKTFNDKFAKTIGVGLNENNKRVKFDQTTGELTNDLFGEELRDFFLKMGDEFLKGDGDVGEDIALAREIAGSTTELAQIMKQGVEYFLSLIYDAVSWIASFFGPEKLTKDEKAARGEASQALRDEIAKDRDEMRAQSIIIKNLERERKRPGLSDKRKAEIDADLGKHKKAVKLLDEKGKIKQAAVGGIQRMNGKELAKFRGAGGDEPLTKEKFIEAAHQSKAARAVAEPLLEKRTGPGTDGYRYQKATADEESRAKTNEIAEIALLFLAPITSIAASWEADDRAKRAQDEVYAQNMTDVYGLSTGVAAYDSSMLAPFVDQDAIEGKGKSTEELLGKDVYLGGVDATNQRLEDEARDARQAEIKLHKKGGVSAKATEDSVYKAMLKLNRDDMSSRIMDAFATAAPGAVPTEATVQDWTKSLLTGKGTPESLKALLVQYPELFEALKSRNIYTEGVQDAIMYQDERGKTRHLSLARGDIARIGPMEAQGNAVRGGRGGGGTTINIINTFPSDKAVASVRGFMENDIRFLTG